MIIKNINNDHIEKPNLGSFEMFYNLFTAPRTVSNTCVQTARAQSCANHMQHIGQSSHATYCVPLSTQGQFSY